MAFANEMAFAKSIPQQNLASLMGDVITQVSKSTQASLSARVPRDSPYSRVRKKTRFGKKYVLNVLNIKIDCQKLENSI